MDAFTILWAIIIIFVVVIISAAFIYDDRRKKKESEKKEKLSSYRRVQPFAEAIKIVLQMFIGVGLIVLLIIKFAHHLAYFMDLTTISPMMQYFLSKYVYNLSTLNIVALALAYSAAIELAYALFTPGPDEAVAPLITGLAAAILLILSSPTRFDFASASGVALLVLALIALFTLKYFFIDKEGLVSFLHGKNNQNELTSSTDNTIPESTDGNGTRDNSTSPNLSK